MKSIRKPYKKNIFAPKKDKPIRETDSFKIFTGKGNILLMDDDEMIRVFARECLAELGYNVSLSTNGAEAIALYKKAIEINKPFDLIILDLCIPNGIGGEETLKRIKEINPSVKAILSSGSYDDPVMVDYKKYGFTAVVPKPYTVHQLSKNIYKVLRGLLI